MFRKSFAVICCFFALACTFIGVVSAKTEKDLRRHLFEGQAYDKLVRPVKNPKTVVPVSVGLTPIALRDVDIEPPSIKVDAWLAVTWQDDYLKWNPKDFDGMEELNLPISEVWSPDLSLYTGAFDKSFFPTVNTNVIIRFDGLMTWVPPITIHNRCGIFKKDKECVISFISWTYDVTHMDINIDKMVNESMTYYEDTYPKFKLKSLDASKELKTFSCCENPYPIIHFKIDLKSK